MTRIRKRAVLTECFTNGSQAGTLSRILDAGFARFVIQTVEATSGRELTGIQSVGQGRSRFATVGPDVLKKPLASTVGCSYIARSFQQKELNYASSEGH